MTSKNEVIESKTVKNETHERNSWLHSVFQKIEDVIDNMDTDFPLSGGVEHPVNHRPFTEHK